MNKLFLFLLLTTMIVSCGPTITVGKTWRDPDTTINSSTFHKVLVAAFLKTENGRRNAEDELVSLLKVPATQSYSYFPGQIKESDRDSLVAKLKTDGFDGALVLRLVDVDKEINYVPGSYSTYPVYYRDFWGYYWNSYTVADATYSPGYYETTRTYSLVMNIYSLKDNKLLWSGLTSYTDPANSQKLIDGSAKAMVKEMKKQGFFTAAK